MSGDDDEDDGGAAAAAASSNSVGVTEQQKEWLNTMTQLLAVKPKVRQQCPSGAWRTFCFRLVRSPHFDHVILLVILFNTMLMALDGYGLKTWQADLLAALNNTCTLIFLTEAVTKIAAYGFPGYLAEAWNVFDFCIVLLSLVDLLITYAAAGLDTNPTLVRILRMLRITRVLRTFRVIKWGTQPASPPASQRQPAGHSPPAA